MSAIGLTEEVTSHDELALVREATGSGCIIDYDAEHIMYVPAAQMDAAEKCFPLIVAMFRKGETIGERYGRTTAQFGMRKALGL